MKLRDAICLAGVDLRRNPLRTLLTILGLGVGVGAILTVVTLGLAGERQVNVEIGRLGVDKLWITPAAEGETSLDLHAAEAVTAAAGDVCCAEAMTAAPVFCGESMVLCSVFGYDERWTALYGPRVREGRLWSAKEYGGSASVLLDTTAAEALSASVGDWVCTGNRMLRVVGIVEPVVTDLFSPAQGSVLLPLRTFLDTWTDHGVDRLTLGAPADGDYDRLGLRAAAALSRDGAGFEVRAMTEEIRAVQQVVRIFVMVLTCVAAVCMLTGSIGVMNILLVSVRERRREIGLIKAVGGTSAQVGVLFLLEAVCYAALGGLLGLAMGMAMIRAFGEWIGLPAALAWDTALPTLLGACLLGVGFGVAPALRAAKMQPVDALRQE